MPFDQLKRRQFITLLGGAAAWPLAAGAQEQSERKRFIGVLLPLAANDVFATKQVGAFVTALQQAGWTDGRNARIEVRWAGPIPGDIRRHAAELVALRPDVVLAYGSSTVSPLLQNTRTVPIVFPVMGDPVAAGYVESLARPGGNATGFMMYEYSFAAKWLELLKEMVPTLKRVAVLRNAATPTGPALLGVIQAVSPYLKVDAMPLNIRNAEEFESAIAGFARGPGDGLIVAASALAQTHRHKLFELVARHKLPAIYGEEGYVTDGGLMSFAPNMLDQFRRAAGYVDRILKGETPAELPVQTPVNYVLSINLKTAKALGLEVPPMLLARADEVIE
jgi:putative tryptophan/tyrosine transport system substrate-binding protein